MTQLILFSLLHQKQPARAIYDFKAQTAKELTFRKGDAVNIVRQIDNNWYEGEHRGRTGIFPISYVEKMASSERQQQPARPPPPAHLREIGEAVARYNFNADTNVELSLRKHSPSRSPAHHVDPHGYPGNRTPGSAPSKPPCILSPPPLPHHHHHHHYHPSSTPPPPPPPAPSAQRALRLQAITDEWLSLTLDTPTRVPGTPAPPTPPPLPPPPPASSAQRALQLQAITDEWLSLTLETPTRGPGTPAPPTPPPLPAHHHHHYLPLLPQTPPPAPPRRGLTPPPPPWRASSGQSSPAFGRVMPEGNRSLVPLVAPPPPSPPPPPPPPTPQPSPYRAGSGRLFCTEMVKHPRLVEHPEVLPQRGWGSSGSSVAERGRESGKTADPYEQLLAMILDFVTGEEDDEKAPARRSPPERSPMYRPPGESHRKQPGKLDSAETTTRTLKATPAAPVGQSTSAVRLQRHKPETIEPPMSVGWQ
ncbi:hypothetical protein CRUP_023709, partial [Coryphaenoides rupestris]